MDDGDADPDRTAMKRRAGERAAADVPDGSVVGLGTGSTAAHAIDALGRRVRDGADLVGVPTSHQSRRRAIDAGVPVRALDQVEGVDVAVDGADEVVFAERAVGSEVPASGGDWPASVLVKGGGAAHAREKVVDAAADRLLVVVDPSKLAARVGHPVPVEVLPVAADSVGERVRRHGGRARLRAADRKDGPLVTDNGNWVLDCEFDAVAEPRSLATALSGLPGVLEHGLFVDLADAVYVGTATGVTVHEVG
jgi:ribose 5-phosphate isomerase A